MNTKKIGTLIKTYNTRREVGDRIYHDSLIIFYRDENGVKQHKFIDRAEVPFYIIKDKSSPEALSQPMFIEESKVEKTMTFSDMLYRDIAMKTNSLYYYDRVLAFQGRDRSNIKNLLKHNWVYDSDMDIADRYVADFYMEYEPNKNYKLHKCFYDIEVDLIGH